MSSSSFPQVLSGYGEPATYTASFHPNLITQWKRHAIEGLADVFSGKTGAREIDHEAQIKDLHAKIGQLTVERDFLAKAFGR